jgi:signal transduction histidine kinase
MAMATGHRTLNLISGAGYAALLMLVVWYCQERDQQRLKSELTYHLMVQSSQIDCTFSISVESLKGLSSHLALKPDLSYRDFKDAISEHLQRQPGLLAIDWQPLVPDQQRATTERRVRNQGGSLANFRIWEPGPGGSRIPARMRPLHLPVLYQESPRSLVGTTGLDLAFSPQRMAAKWRAADSGTPQASNPNSLLTRETGRPSPVPLVISLPIYKDGFTPKGQALRRTHLLGFLALLYDIRPMLSPHQQQLAKEGLTLTVQAPGMEPVQLGNATDPAISMEESTQLNLYGIRLNLTMGALPAFIANQKDDFSSLLIGSVTLFGALALGLQLFLQRSNRRLSGTQAQLTRTVEELKQARTELEFQRQQLKLKLRASITASVVAHEINQPLGTMRLLGQQLIDRAQTGTMDRGTILTLLNHLMQESDQVVETTEKMRMLLRNTQTNHACIDLARVMQTTLLYLRRLLCNHQVEIETQGIEQPAPIEGDGAQLRIALANLIRNAVEALARQPSHRRLIRITLQVAPSAVHLKVADSGPGFPAEILNQASREDALLHTDKAAGSGIGLYVVSTTMENHKGTITLGRSEALGGAEVCLSFHASCQANPGESVTNKALQSLKSS